MNAAPHRSALAARLPRIPPQVAQALRRLFAAGLEWRAEPAWRLRVSHGAAPATTVALIDGAHGPLGLGIEHDDWIADIGPRAWQDYADASRVLAYTLAHERLLSQLGTLLRCDFRPLQLGDGADQPLRLGWTLHDGEGRSARGSLQTDPAQWLAWAEHAQPATAPEAPGDLVVPAALTFTLRGFPLAELRASAPGDVLVLGARARVWSSLQLALGARRWRVAWEGGRLRVLGALSSSLQPAPLSPSQECSVSVPEEPVTQAGEALIDALPVELTFQLGSLQLTVAEATRLAPGYVFELPDRLEHVQVRVQANGRTIGRGELVVVGETLGVQLLELAAASDGLQ